MHCFASENQTCTGTVIVGVESFKVFKSSTKPTAEKSTTENPLRKRPIFVIENIFCEKVYGIQNNNEMAFKRTVTSREFSISRHQI